MTVRRERPLSQTQYQVRISVGPTGTSIDNIYFTSFSGIKDRSQSIQYADGRRQKKYKMMGARDIEDVQLSAPYKPEEHQALIDAWKQYTCEELQIEVQPVACGTSGNAEETPLGEPYILTGCQWLAFEGPEVNKEGNDVSRVMCTFSVDDWDKGSQSSNLLNTVGI
jgi:hypothetical protein